MRYFTNRSQLSRMELNTKLIMTYFLVFMLLATALSIFMSVQRTNLEPQAAAEYYRGSDTCMVFPKEPTELIETTHFHIYMMPFVFVTTGHLFLLSAWNRRWKTVVITGGFIYVLLDISKPWLIRYVSAGFGMLAPINSTLMAVTMLICIIVPLYEMWFLRTDQGRALD